jgi:hypothetical protein
LPNWFENLKAIAAFRHKEPTQIQLMREQGRLDALNSEIRNIDTETQASGGVDFVFASTKDEWILGLFDSSYPQFCPLVLPLSPLFQPTVFLTFITEQQARTYKRMLDRGIARLKNKAESPEDFMLLESLRCYGYMRINDSVQGFKMDKLTTRKRILETPGFGLEVKKT